MTTIRAGWLATGVLATLFLGGCGGSSPTSPSSSSFSTSSSSSSIPSVAGSYSGSATFTYPEQKTSITCPATTTVTQSAATIDVAPIQLGGQCNSTMPLGQSSIDNNGVIAAATGSGSYTDATCGVYDYTGTGSFSGRTFLMTITLTSPTCNDVTFSMALTR